MTLSNKTERPAIVDTHRHPIGPKLAAKMGSLYDPKQPFPQTNDKGLICYREFFDSDYTMPKQREAGVTLSLASNGGEAVKPRKVGCCKCPGVAACGADILSERYARGE